MNKKLFFMLPLAILLGIFTASAQNMNDDYHPLVQEGKVWVQSIIKPDQKEAWFFYSLHSDTIVNGKKYKKMYESRGQYTQHPYDWNVRYLFREDENRKVWIKPVYATDEYLLYDFSLQIGDTVKCYYPYHWPTNLPPVLVSEITDYNYFGDVRKVFWFTETISDFGKCWIEGIGSSYGPTKEATPYSEVFLKCYYEKRDLVYCRDFIYDFLHICYLPFLGFLDIGENDYDVNAGINIYPNPANDILFIENSKNIDIRTISILNIYGQIVREFEPHTTQLEISNIPVGIYFLKIATEQGDVMKKVIKQ